MVNPLPPTNNRIRMPPWKTNPQWYTTPPNITALTPLTATLANAGAAGRTVADIDPVGGTAPFKWSIASNPGNMAVGINPDTGVILTQANPVAATTGAKNLSVKAVDVYGKTVTNIVVVTLT